MSGSVSHGKDKSQSLQMMGRPLITPDELKSMPKDTFIVTKTGSYPMKTIMRLFFKWGIALDRNYTMPEPVVREISYADKENIEAAIVKKYPPKGGQTEVTNQSAAAQQLPHPQYPAPKTDGNKKLKAVGGAIKEKMDKEDADGQ